ncbi:MAG: DEAD/DEAH box helicase family protein, partial [Clostridiales bacterium]|nr:DEAD/DEAH box helicase family protein [Clostridiales bacterium]
MREPQRQSYYKVYEHFVLEQKTSHALLVLPTGIGKTGIMGIIPYQISKGRVLIITPQLTVKDTIIDSLNTENHDNFWLERKVLTEVNLPSIIEYEGQRTKDEVLNEADIVVINIQRLQERLASSLINRLPEDYFDMIIIDEAHHSPANTWIESIQHFSDAKVVKLTATPYRTDGRKIAGELIYNYRLSQAMAYNYVKSLEMHEYIPDELTFIMDNDDSKEYTLEEVMELKDEEWISRNVAYSPECSAQVVEESIAILESQKGLSDLPHMIIAVACGIEHANQISELYRKRNIRVGIIHSDMNPEDIEAVKSDITNYRLDVIVNVGMLGEGYDHKYLSVAAIFRPFRSKLPYAQFIGRILRFIPEAPQSGDNIGHIISHKHLYLDELWNDYKIEIAQSEIIRHLQEQDYLEFEEPGGGEGTPHRLDFAKVISSSGSVSTDAYLETELLRKAREESEQLNEKILKLSQLLDITKQAAKDIIKSQQTVSKLKRPDKVYNRSRRNIDLRIKEDIVPDLVVKYSIPQVVKPLSDSRLFISNAYRWIPARVNDEQGMLAVYFNQYLKTEIGKVREEWL